MTTMNIDWDAATFESGEDERERQRREAMEALQMRLAERDAQRGLVPTTSAVFPPGMEPQPATPSPQAGAPAPQTPGGAVPSPPPSSSPSPLDPGPPAISTSPQPPEPTAEASTNPEAQTVTAGAQAAELRRQGQPQGTPPPAPIGGQTGLGGPDATAQAMEAFRPPPPTFDDQRAAARDEDTRRRRWRAILMGLAAIMGSRTAASGGSTAGALPGLIAAGLVRRPDEEETLLEGDTRQREIGAQEAEQASVLQRLQQAREAQSAQDAYRQQQLAIKLQELQGDQEDRAIRTGLAVNDDQREAAMVDPTSRESQMARERLRRLIPTLPEDIGRQLADMDLGSLSARDIDILQRDYAGIETGRQRGGGSGQVGTGAYAGTSAEGGLQGAGVAPAWYVTQVAEGNGRAPGQETAEDRTVADASWQQLSPERRAQMETTNSQAGAETIAATGIMERAGYEQAVGGHIPSEQRNRAMAANSTRDAINAQVSRGLRALDEFGGQGWWEAGTGLLADFFGSNANDAIAAYNSARSGVMSQLAIARGAGVIGEAEYGRFVREMPDVSSVAGLVGAARSMQQIANEINANAEAVIGAAGYRPIQGGQRHGLSYRTGQGGGARQEQQPAQQRSQGDTVRLRFRDADGNAQRTRPLRPDQVDAARQIITSSGGSIIE